MNCLLKNGLDFNTFVEILNEEFRPSGVVLLIDVLHDFWWEGVDYQETANRISLGLGPIL